MKLYLPIAGAWLLVCSSVFSAPLPETVEFDEDCVEELNEPLEVDAESLQMPEIEPAIAEPDAYLFYDESVDENAEDCEDDYVEPTEPQAMPIEDEYECEEEEAPIEDFSEEDYETGFNAAFDEASSIIVADDVSEIIDEECEEVTAEAVPLEDDDYFGFNIEPASVEEADYQVMQQVSDESELEQIDECEE